MCCLPKYKLNYFVHINRQKLVFHFIYVSLIISRMCVNECVRCFDVIFLIVSYIKQSPNVNFCFSVQGQPCTFDSCSPLHCSHLEQKVNKGRAELASIKTVFSRFGSKRKQFQNWNTHLNPASKNYRILLLFWCYFLFSMCDSVAFCHDCHDCCLWLFWGTHARHSIAFDSAGLLCSLWVGLVLLLFRTFCFCYFSVKLPICGWIFVLFRVVLIMRFWYCLILNASKKGGKPSVFSVVKS